MNTGAPLYLVSACGTAEEFVAAFRRYADRTGLFIPSAAPLPAGRRGRLALTLKDGGVMIEGEAEILQSSAKPSVLHGRPGMMVKFVEPDELSRTVIGELEKARLAMKPAPPSVPPRPADVPAEPRPVVPTVGGRIDAANALAECVVIGDPSQLVDTASAPRSVNDPASGKAKFTVPSIPGVGGSRPNSPSTPPPMRANTPSAPPPMRANTPSAPPPFGEPRARTPSVPPDPASKPLPAPTGKKLTSVGFPAFEKAPAFPPKTNVPGAAPAQQAPTTPAAPAENPLLQTKMGVKPPENRTREQAAQPDPEESPQPGSRAAINATTHGMPPIAKEPAVSVHEESTTVGEEPPTPPELAAPAPVATKQPTAPTVPMNQPTGPTPAPKPPAHAKAHKATSIGFPAVRTPFETQALGTVRPPAGTAPVAPVIPEGSSARPGAGAPGPRGKNATRPPLTPRHPTPVAPVPIVRSPAKAAPHVEDAIVENAIVEEEKTDLTEVPLPPSGATSIGVEDTVDAAPAKIDAIVDPHASTHVGSAPQRSGGMRASEIMAAIPSGDWTMSPDASGPTVVGGAPAKAETPMAIESKLPPKGPPTGNWAISLDPDVGWSEPVKLEKSPEPAPKPAPKPKTRKGSGTAGNPDMSVADEKGFMAQEWEEKPTGIGEAKIEIDSTLMEPLKPMPALDDEDEPQAAGSMPRMATVDGKQITYVTPPAGNPVVASAPTPFAAPQVAAPPQHAPAPPHSAPHASRPMMAQQNPYPTPASGVVSPFAAAPPSPFAVAPGSSPYAAMTPGPFAAPPPPMTGPVAAAAGYSNPGMPAQQSNLFASSQPVGDPNYQMMGFAPADHSRPAPKAASRARTVIIGVAAIAALVAGFVLVLVLAGGKDKKQTAKNNGKGSGSAGSAVAAVVVNDGSGSAMGSGAGSAEPPLVGSGSAEPVGSGSAIEIDEPAGSGSGSAAVVVETPPPAGGPCKVTVTSAPNGADVYQGTQKLGTTPLETELPCAVEAKLTLKKAKFVSTAKAFTPAEGKGNKIAVKLAKPTFTLKITSTPAGATITVGGKSMGVTPATIKLTAFESAAIKVGKPGYAAESKAVTPKSNNLSQHFVLKKGRK